MPFRWSSECGKSFEWLKEKLITSPILAYPQLDRNSSPFVLHTDASGQGIGAVLEQEGHVIGYASRSLSQSEQNYSVIQKECLAIVYATKQFRHYLLGRTFQLFTDHAPLQWLSAQKAEGMLCRWALMLQEFDFKISYKPGVKNTNADTLTRIPYQQCATTMFTSSDYRNLIQNAQQTDPIIFSLYKALKSKQRPITTDPVLRQYCQLWSQLKIINGLVCRQYTPDPSSPCVTVPILPASTRNQVLQENHDAPAAGHMGVSKTLYRIRKEAYWVNMAKDVRKDCQQRVKCQESRPPRPQPAPLQNVPIGAPWQMVAIDILEVPTSTSNNRYLLVFQDYFTKWPEAIPLPNQTADLISKEAIKIFTKFGIPDIIHSDQGRNFESYLFQSTLKAFGVEKSRTTAYHPQGDGMVERFNRSLLQLLRSYVDVTTEWEKYLPLVLYAYRTTQHASTCTSPFVLMYGREPKFCPLLKGQSGFEPQSYIEQLQYKMFQMQQLVEANLAQAAEIQKIHYDQSANIRCFKPGHKVWLNCPTAGKLSPRWEGGWKVREITNPVTVEIDCQTTPQDTTMGHGKQLRERKECRKTYCPRSRT
jgi:transposase InsO family protein